MDIHIQNGLSIALEWSFYCPGMVFLLPWNGLSIALEWSFHCPVSPVNRFLVFGGAKHAGPSPVSQDFPHKEGAFSQEAKAFLCKGFRNGQKVAEKHWFEA